MAETALHPSQAKTIVDAETKYDEAKRALAAAKRHRDETRARYRELVPLGEAITVAGHLFKRIRKTSGPSFRLRAYLEKHKLTKAMEPYVGEPTEYEDWQVKRA